MLRLRRAATWTAGALALGLAVTVAIPPDVGTVFSPQLLADDGTLLSVRPTADGFYRLPVTGDVLTAQMRAMLLTYEDKRFASHPGIDPLALARAAGQGLRAGAVVSGASTLTMQVARLVWRTPHTFLGKLRQMLLALRLEAHLSKAEILTLYLQRAPYGGNLEGIRAGSRAWFGKDPRALTPAEAALLIALPQAPESVRPDRFPARARAARHKVLMRMVAAGVLRPDTAAEATAAPLPTRRLPFPAQAPHLAARLTNGTAAVSTTLDARLQQRLERWAQQQAALIPPPASFAVLVADNRRRVALAWLGSPDVHAAARQGAVDMVRAVRSPGSTLKPLIYALALDAGVITPTTVFDDRPSWFGSYHPQNFGETFAGQVPLSVALQRSLNVPAVLTLDRLGAARGYAALRQTGITLRWRGPDAQPGLPLALGGVGTRLIDLVALYQALATDGRFARLRVVAGESPAAPQPFVSATAAATIRSILADAPLPPGLTRADSRRIAFKTGTSYGFRDAWAVGVSGDYTVGVWLGRADGSPLPGQFGIKSAAPLLFSVFALLPPDMGTGSKTAAASLPPPRFVFTPPPAAARPQVPRVQLVFPRDGMTLWAATVPPEGLPLTATGGTPPYSWLINGRPLSAQPGAEPLWQPDSIGEAALVVVDRDGRQAAGRVWVDGTER
jgi:penicillin-binding protein 1C